MEYEATEAAKCGETGNNVKNAGLAFCFFAVISFLSVMVDLVVEIWSGWGMPLDGSLAAVESLIGLRILRPVVASTAFAIGLAVLFDHPRTSASLKWVVGQALGAFACVWGAVLGFVLAAAARGLGVNALNQMLVTTTLLLILAGGCRLAWTKGEMGRDIVKMVGRIPIAVRAVIAIPFMVLAPVVIITTPMAMLVGGLNWFRLA